MEIGEEYAYISLSIPEKTIITPEKWNGIDRNATGHIAVVGDPQTGKIWKLGKKQSIYIKSTVQSGKGYRRRENTGY